MNYLVVVTKKVVFLCLVYRVVCVESEEEGGGRRFEELSYLYIKETLKCIHVFNTAYGIKTNVYFDLANNLLHFTGRVYWYYGGNKYIPRTISRLAHP